MPDPDTIRSILERIRDGNDHADKHDNACTHCWTQREAVAALELIDKARVIEGRYYGNSPYIWFKDGERIRLIPDPEAAS